MKFEDLNQAEWDSFLNDNTINIIHTFFKWELIWAFMLAVFWTFDYVM